MRGRGFSLSGILRSAIRDRAGELLSGRGARHGQPFTLLLKDDEADDRRAVEENEKGEADAENPIAVSPA